MRVKVVVIFLVGLLVSCTARYTDLQQFIQDENDQDTRGMVEQLWNELSDSHEQNAFGITKKEGTTTISLYGMVVKHDELKDQYLVIGVKKNFAIANYEKNYDELVRKLEEINEQ